MKNLVVFLYFVFLFKLAIAQSLPSLPGLDSENIDDNPNLIPEYVEVPSKKEDAPSLTPPSFDDDTAQFDVPPPVFDDGWQDAPAAPSAPVDVMPIAEAPSLEIDQFKKNSFDKKPSDDFAQELQVDDGVENLTIDNLLEGDNFEMEVSKEQFPTTPSLGGLGIQQQNADSSPKNNFKTENVEEKENEVLEALFKGQKDNQGAAEIPLEDLAVSDGDAGVDRFNDFEKVTNTRAIHHPVTYSEDQLVDQLVKASMVGNKSAVLSLLHSGRSANAKNKFGETPLMASIYNGHNSITEILLAEGADPNISDNKANTALHVASSKKNYFAVEQLLKHGALRDPRNRSNDTPLLIATLNNSLDIVDLLIRNGADVNKSNDDGLTPLHVATFNSNIEIVKYLLYVGANANMINRDGLKPYDLAYGKNLEIARLLAGYTGREKFISNDLPQLIQQQNNINNQPTKLNNYSQQFSLFPESFANNESNNQELSKRQTAWWGARQTASKSVMPVQNTEIYAEPTHMSQQQYSATPLPKNYSQAAPISTPQPIEQQPIQVSQNISTTPKNFDYDQMSRDRAKEASLSNVSSITNNYAPTKKPKNIISQSINFIGSRDKPKSDVYNGDPAYAGLPTPKSMARQNQVATSSYVAPNPYNNYKPTAPKNYSYSQQPSNVASRAQPTKRVVTYSELPLQKRASWDRNLEKWLKASSKLAQFSPAEKRVWKKQRTILQSVYQNQFHESVEKAKRKILAQQSSSINRYGRKVVPLNNGRRSTLTRRQVGRVLKTSYLRNSQASSL